MEKTPAENSEYKRWCDNKRNKRLRAENDYNRVQNEYLMVKYEPVAQEFSEFYDSLREKYPQKHTYKGSKKFRTWVRSEIEKYDSNKNTEEQNVNDVPEAVVRGENVNDVSEAVVRGENVNDVSEAVVRGENVNDVPEAVVNVNDIPEAVACGENAVAVPEAVSLGEIIDDTIGENVVVPAPLENIIANGPLENILANGLPQELEELDAIIGNIIADIESQCDEGISLSPHHELEPEPLYYEEEIEGLDDIEFDMPLDLLEAELEIQLENF